MVWWWNELQIHMVSASEASNEARQRRQVQYWVRKWHCIFDGGSCLFDALNRKLFSDKRTTVWDEVYCFQMRSWYVLWNFTSVEMPFFDCISPYIYQAQGVSFTEGHHIKPKIDLLICIIWTNIWKRAKRYKFKSSCLTKRLRKNWTKINENDVILNFI